jgi:hypothetical protein
MRANYPNRSLVRVLPLAVVVFFSPGSPSGRAADESGPQALRGNNCTINVGRFGRPTWFGGRFAKPVYKQWNASYLSADPKPSLQEGRPGVAVCLSDTGTILRREAPGKPWQVVAKDEAIHGGDLLLGLPGAVMQSKNGKVRLTFRSDLTGQAPLPIIETAVIVHDSKDDLDCTLDRGRVDLTNIAKEGAARVQLRIRDKTGEITLKAPGARLGIEMFGRWPAGTPFTKKAEASDGPAHNLIFLVFYGEVDIKGPSRHFALTAPKGPAMLEWDSVTGDAPAAQYLETLPDWAKEDKTSAEAREKLARLDEFRKLAVSKSIPAAVETFLNSDDPGKRRLAVFAMGALDDLSGLANALANAKHLDVWDNGVIALRHWIGRGPGQDMKLYNGLINEGKFKTHDAEAVLQLLHGFSEADLGRPETYETLIDYLDHGRLALRGLAYWHLSRLVPAGRALGFNPLDAKEQRQKAVAKWRELVPSGQLPKPTKREGN